MSCQHDQTKYGLFGLPKEARGCLACAYEHRVADNERLRGLVGRYRSALEQFAPDVLDEIDAALGTRNAGYHTAPESGHVIGSDQPTDVDDGGPYFGLQGSNKPT